jgi:hypothetical protein
MHELAVLKNVLSIGMRCSTSAFGVGPIDNDESRAAGSLTVMTSPLHLMPAIRNGHIRWRPTALNKLFLPRRVCRPPIGVPP